METGDKRRPDEPSRLVSSDFTFTLWKRVTTRCHTFVACLTSYSGVLFYLCLVRGHLLVIPARNSGLDSFGSVPTGSHLLALQALSIRLRWWRRHCYSNTKTLHCPCAFSSGYSAPRLQKNPLFHNLWMMLYLSRNFLPYLQPLSHRPALQPLLQCTTWICCCHPSQRVWL